MMKRIIALLLSAFLLSGISFAEDAAYCQHEREKRPFLINEVRTNYIQAFYPDDSDAFYGYALCTLCSDIALLVTDPNMVDPKPCEPDNCLHRLYVLPDFNYQAWKTTTDYIRDPKGDYPYDELRQYEVGVCVDCNQLILLYEAVETSEHQMVEKQGFHIEGQYIHVICEECTQCGMMTGELVPCISHEDGSCERSK